MAIGVTVLAAQTGKPVPHSVTAVRHWSLGGVTRIAVEVSGEFQYRSDRLQNPDRIYYDILNARPNFDSKRLYTEDLGGAFVKRIRVAETLPGVTRVVLDLDAGVEAAASVLSSPDRLIIELRGGAPPAARGARADRRPVRAAPDDRLGARQSDVALPGRPRRGWRASPSRRGV